jgi:hypothetical protein
MSAVTPIADIGRHLLDVRFVPTGRSAGFSPLRTRGVASGQSVYIRDAAAVKAARGQSSSSSSSCNVSCATQSYAKNDIKRSATTLLWRTGASRLETTFLGSEAEITERGVTIGAPAERPVVFSVTLPDG